MGPGLFGETSLTQNPTALGCWVQHIFRGDALGLIKYLCRDYFQDNICTCGYLDQPKTKKKRKNPKCFRVHGLRVLMIFAKLQV